ncbi:MAG: hypothetical protein RTU30_12020 [Candidatus Thorarchaeota archaeon]
MPEQGQYSDTTQRCAYCGRDEVSWPWMGRMKNYCSYDCYAKGQYSMNIFCGFFVIPFASLLTIGMLIALLQFSLPDPMYISLWVFTTSPSVIWGHMIFLGRRADRQYSFEQTRSPQLTES